MRRLVMVLVVAAAVVSCDNDSGVEEAPPVPVAEPDPVGEPAGVREVGEPAGVEGSLPEAPPFMIGMPPGEGFPLFQARGPTLELREVPSSEATVVQRLELEPGIQITYDEVQFQTAVPGQVVTVETASIAGYNFGAVQALSRDDYYDRSESLDGTIDVAVGDTIDHLQARAEGSCFVRIAGNVWEAELCPTWAPEFTVVSEPLTEWWIRVTDGQVPQGWLLVNDSTLTVDRMF